MTLIDKRLSSHMAHHSYWETESQILWCDFRKIYPKLGVQSVVSWDTMLMSQDPIPLYNRHLNPLAWPKTNALSDWQKQIPVWVKESCLLFPSHQMALLHYCGRYPQMLTLLDEAPILAWQLIKSSLTEPEIVLLLSKKRIHQVEEIGWPAKAETLKFIHKLRLRKVTPELVEQVEVCVLDENRSLALQALPRINSMALSLAARFPKMIGCKLHQALAAMPCRPMQCQAMIALLEDAYSMAHYFKLSSKETDQIGQQRYLVEVEQLMAEWMQANAQKHPGLVSFKQNKKPQLVTDKGDWWGLSWHHNHLWMSHWADYQAGKVILWVFEDEKEGLIGFLEAVDTNEIVRVRQAQNQLPTAEQLSMIHLWQMKS
jgi:hypothetical protein